MSHNNTRLPSTWAWSWVHVSIHDVFCMALANYSWHFPVQEIARARDTKKQLKDLIKEGFVASSARPLSWITTNPSFGTRYLLPVKKCIICLMCQLSSHSLFSCLLGFVCSLCGFKNSFCPAYDSLERAEQQFSTALLTKALYVTCTFLLGKVCILIKETQALQRGRPHWSSGVVCFLGFTLVVTLCNQLW